MGKVGPLVRPFFLGTVRYKKALGLQHNLVSWNKCDPKTAFPTLLLLQHHPVYTIGYRDKQYSDDERRHLESLGADFVKTNRGGLITFHGPGQLIAYPIFSRYHIPIGVRDYVCQLEQVIINLCERYGITAGRSPHTGVWVGDSKICAMDFNMKFVRALQDSTLKCLHRSSFYLNTSTVLTRSGINAQQNIYSHGIALNCNTDMLWFSRIVPCGIKDKGVTSLSVQTGRNITVEEVMPHLVKEISSVFKWDMADVREVCAEENVDDESIFEEITKTRSKSIKEKR